MQDPRYNRDIQTLQGIASVLSSGLSKVKSTREQSQPNIDSFSMAILKQLMDKITWVKGEKGERGATGIMGLRGLKGDKGDRGEKGDKGDKPIAGVDYEFPKNGKDGKDGSHGKDGIANMVAVSQIADHAIDSHIQQFNHDPFLIGSKEISEAGMKDGDFIQYDAKDDKLIYSTIKQVASQVSRFSGRGFSLPSQSGNAGKFLTTDGQQPSWETVTQGTGGGGSAIKETPTGTINGSNTIFTLSNTPVTDSECVFLNGVLQTKGASNDYTLTGAIITYNSAPPDGSTHVVIYGLTDGTVNSANVTSLGFTIDGGGSAITTGVKGYLSVPFACTINSWVILADQSGSIVIDLWKDTLANFPPTIADTITGSEKPTLSSATNNTDTNLTTWNTTVAEGDIIAFKVDSATTVTRVQVFFKVTKT